MTEHTKYLLFSNRIVWLQGDIDDVLAGELISNLLSLSILNSQKPIQLYINSAGGNVANGLMPILDVMQKIPCPIETICCGEAYSSAAIILAAGTKGLRKSYLHSSMMIHCLSQEDISGTPSEIDKESKRIAKQNKQLMEITASLTGKSLRKIKNDCKKDKYLTAKEAIEYGLIDQII